MKQSSGSNLIDVTSSPVAVETSRRSFIRGSSQLAIASATSLGVVGALFSTNSYAVTTTGYKPPYNDGFRFCYSKVNGKGIEPTIGAYTQWIEYWMKEVTDDDGDICTKVNVYWRKAYTVNSVYTENWSIKHSVRELKYDNNIFIEYSTNVTNGWKTVSYGDLARADCQNRRLSRADGEAILTSLLPTNHVPGSNIFYASRNFLGSVPQFLYMSYRLGESTYWRFVYFSQNEVGKYVASMPISQRGYPGAVEGIIDKINAYNAGVTGVTTSVTSAVVGAAVGFGVAQMAQMTNIPAVGIAAGFCIAAQTGVMSINNAYYDTPARLLAVRLAITAFDTANWVHILADRPDMLTCAADDELRI